MAPLSMEPTNEQHLPENWRLDIAAACDAMVADPARGIPVADVFAELRAHHAARTAPRNGEP